MITRQPWDQTAKIGHVLADEIINTGINRAKENLSAYYNEAQNKLESIQNETVEENANLQDQLALYAKKCGASSASAAMAAVVDGSSNILNYIDEVRQGRMNIKDAASRVLGETVTSAVNSAIEAAGASGKAILRERYGSEEAASQKLAEQGVQILLEKLNLPNKQRLADMAVNMISLGTGKMSGEVFQKKCGSLVVKMAKEIPGCLTSTAGLGSVKSFIMNGGTGGKAIMQIIGKTNAFCIAAVAMGVAVMNGIERPYRDLMMNTRSIKAAAAELEQVSAQMRNGQILFTKFLESNVAMDDELQKSMSLIDIAGKNALDAICKI